MDERLPLTGLDLFEAFPAVIEIGTVDEAARTVGIGDPDADGAAVGHDAEALFAFL